MRKGNALLSVPPIEKTAGVLSCAGPATPLNLRANSATTQVRVLIGRGNPPSSQGKPFFKSPPFGIALGLLFQGLRPI